MSTASQWHYFTGDARPSGNDFAQVAREQGLKAAFEARDSPFTEEGLL